MEQTSLPSSITVVKDVQPENTAPSKSVQPVSLILLSFVHPSNACLFIVLQFGIEIFVSLEQLLKAYASIISQDGRLTDSKDVQFVNTLIPTILQAGKSACIKPVQSKEGRTDLSRVFFRGFGDRPDFSIVLPAKQTAIPSTRKNKLPIEGRHNVNLGPEDASHDCSTRGADGKFEHFTMTSGEIKAHYEAQQKAYMTERRAKDKEETPVPVASQPQSQVIADDDYAID